MPQELWTLQFPARHFLQMQDEAAVELTCSIIVVAGAFLCFQIWTVACSPPPLQWDYTFPLPVVPQSAGGAKFCKPANMFTNRANGPAY